MNDQTSFSPKMQQIFVEVSAYTKRRLLNKVLGSKTFLQGSNEPLIPFRRDEITLGRVIGNGEFCNVQEVLDISVKPHATQMNPNQADDEECFQTCGNNAIIIRKKKMMESSLREKTDEKYVIKCLKATTKANRPHFQRGLLDLMIETKALSLLSHPNIIGLRGFNRDGLYKHDYFLVLEMLDSTLREKLDEWKKRPQNKGFFRKVFERKNKMAPKNTLKDKLSIFRDLSSALSYMHSLRIIHRDLKPLNIGFSQDGTVKLFDFGLAAELRSDRLQSNGLYRLSGNTGTRRYMAPEIARREPYNDTVDVYSFGILLWEALAKMTPFEGYSIDMFQIFVATMGDRLVIDDSWPPAVQVLIQNCWAQDHRRRPTSTELFDTMKNIVAKL